VDQLPLDEDGDIPMRTLSQRHRQDRGRDLLVLVTDLPRRAGTKPVVAGIDAEHGVAMISLPALGAVRVRCRVRALLIRVVRQSSAHEPALSGLPGLRLTPGPALSLSSSKEAEARVGVSCGRSGETGVL
jgi:hypothetical protein